MSECTHDCSTCGQSCSQRTEPESLLQKPHEQSHIKKVIGVCSGKGGVGKSMVTSLLAVAMQRMGLKVGILDADITGPSIPREFGLKQKAEGNDTGIFPVRTTTGIDVMSLNLLLPNDSDPVAWRGPIIAGAVTQFWTDVIWGDKDVLFIDMPPGTGDVMLTVCQSIPVDAAVLVSTPQELVGMIVEKSIKMVDMLNIPVIGLVENMSYVQCPDCGKKIAVFGESHVDAIARQYGIPHTAALPIDRKLAASADKGMIELTNGDWLDEIANAIDQLQPRKRK
ncbi:MAG: Mrp/NBP35 family ATP-binding protein [Candidatus Limiplasma sp.]|nr:Mrp/NBP35 family ATP-binding protein [Clostridiales bacterium]MDY4062779.1 Mrp/NBP35 family ATP-binding protein [Candidatus Limiplasma sp.]